LRSLNVLTAEATVPISVLCVGSVGSYRSLCFPLQLRLALSWTLQVGEPKNSKPTVSFRDYSDEAFNQSGEGKWKFQQISDSQNVFHTAMTFHQAL
jgi:hypothetical protein